MTSDKTYNSDQLPVKVLQFGEGNFLRCFVDWIIDEMNRKGLFGGSVVIVQPIKDGKIEVINQQKGKYNIFLRGIDKGVLKSERYFIESVSKGIDAYSQFDQLLTEAENPDLRFIISNTTEAGIVDDHSDSPFFKPPTSFPGKLVALLYHRFNYFNKNRLKGFIFLPCELIDSNGATLRAIILDIIDRWNLGDDFKNWIKTDNRFYNTLVDRIVTGYPADRAEIIKKEIGYEDKLAVDGELFHLWVIEAPDSITDEFPVDRSGLNVLIVDNLIPYRERKVRILNGSHTIMTPVSYLLGLNTVREAIEDPIVGEFIRKTILEEIIPNIDLAEKELLDFAASTVERFSNPFINHNLINISLNSISKFRVRVLPTLLKHFDKTNKLPDRIVFSFACLLMFYRGNRNGTPFIVKDSEHIVSFFSDQWMKVDNAVISLDNFIFNILTNHDLWHQDLSLVPGLVEKIKKNLSTILKVGIAKAIQSYV